MIKMIYVALLVLLCSSCIDREGFWRMESAVAKVGKASLFPSEVASAIPEGLSSGDSVAFASRYIQRWTQREAKLQRAETLFASSAEDIEHLVEEYRRKLLLDKLDRQIILESSDTVILDSQIREYYDRNITQFRVEKPLVKFKVLCYSTPYSSSANLLKLFSSDKSSDVEDLRSICEKNLFRFSEMDDQWYDFNTVFTLLPLLEGEESESILTNEGVQSFSYEEMNYYLKILSYRNVGDDTPFELTQEKIKGILRKQRENQTLLNYEDGLYRQALKSGDISFPSTSHIR